MMKTYLLSLCFAVALSSGGLHAVPQVPNGDFQSQTEAGAPEKWSPMTWPKQAELPEGFAAGKEGKDAYVVVPAEVDCSTGWVSQVMPLQGLKQGFRILFKVSASMGYQGAKPWVFLGWHKDGGFLERLDVPVKAVKAEQGWVTVTMDIRPDQIPAEATGMSVNLGSISQKDAEVDGGLRYAGVELLPMSSAAQTEMKMLRQVIFEAGAPASWWTLGETVVYRHKKGELDASSKVSGRVFDTSGKQVASVDVDLESFMKDGWRWKPAVPGFYEVEFSQVIDGKRVPYSSSFVMKGRSGDSQEFVRERYQFAVASEKSAPNPKRGQFGFTYHYSPSDIPLAQLVGFDFALFHSLGWGGHFTDLGRAIEPEKGKFNWALPDEHIKLLTDAGIPIAGQFCYTPVWASPHPETVDKINICVREATAYAPKDVNDYANFVSAVVNRYKDRIHNWEMWNEPNMPNSSCFWADTPENFVKMLEAGYKAVKKAQPDAVVWVGGLGPRRSYHAFYNRILKLGAADYFDVLSMHGTWNSPEIFQDIDTRNKVAHKPTVMSEWHAILTGNGQGTTIPSEEELSLRMLSDLLYQLKHGVSRSILFQMAGNIEKETLGFAQEQKMFNHSSGLFRVTPYLEPRLAAVTMQAFLVRVGNAAEYVKEGKLASGLDWVLLKTAKGPLMVAWVEKDTPASTALGAIAAKDMKLYNWENKPLEKTSGTILKPGILYYLTGVPAEVSDGWAVADVLVNPKMVKANMGPAPEGPLLVGKLFDKAEGPSVNPAAPWIDKGWVLKPDGAVSAGQQAKFAAGISEQGLDLVVEVKDKVHQQNEPDPNWWNGDSIQVALDCEGSGLFGGNAEFIAALTKGGAKIWKLTAADVGGDIPVNWSPSDSSPKNVDLSIQRIEGKTLYKIRIPWPELYPLVYEPTVPIKLSMVVNNSDGGERTYLEWASGIGNDKDPSQYGTLKP